MIDISLCPACLTEFPVGYPYDHVAVDRAVAGDRRTFVSMTTPERAEVVITGLAGQATLLDLVALLSWPYNQLQALRPDEHPASRASQDAEEERLVRELWERRTCSTSPSRLGQD